MPEEKTPFDDFVTPRDPLAAFRDTPAVPPAGASDVGKTPFDDVIARGAGTPFDTPPAPPPAPEVQTQPTAPTGMERRLTTETPGYQQRKEKDEEAHFKAISRKEGFTQDYDPTLSDDYGLRFNIARSTSDRDVVQKFQEKYPEGRIKKVKTPGGDEDVWMFQRDKDSPTQVLRGGVPETAAYGTKPQVVIPAVATAAAYAVNPAVGLGAQTLIGAVGGFTGTLLDQAIEEQQGYTGRPVSETLLEAGKEALGQTVGGAVVGAPTLAKKGLEIAGQISPKAIVGRILESRGQMEEVKAAGERLAGEGLGAEGMPTIAQATSDPKIKMLAKIAGSTNEILVNKANAQRDELVGFIREKLVQGGQLTKEEIGALAERDKQDAFNLLPASMRGAGVSPGQAGQATQSAAQRYEQSSLMQVNQKMNDVEGAFVKENGRFNIGEVKDLADDMVRGNWGPAVDVRVKGRFAPNEGVQTEGLPAALQPVVDKIQGLNRILKTFNKDGEKFSAARQLADIREDLEPLTRSKDPNVRDYAGALHDRLKAVAENPTNVSSETAAAWRGTLDHMGTREENLRLLGKTIGEVNPSKLGIDIVAPGNGQVLGALKQAAPEEFQQVADAFKTSLIRDPGKALGKIGKFLDEPQTLSMVMSPQEVEGIRAYALQFKKIENSGLTKVLKAGKYDDVNLLDTGLPGLVDRKEVNRLIANDPNSREATELRGSLYSKILKGALSSDEASGYKETVNATKVRKGLEDLRAEATSGRFADLFRPEDRQVLKDLTTMMSVNERALSNAGGMVSLGNIAEVRKIKSPIAWARDPKAVALAMFAFANNATFASVLAQPTAGKIMVQGLQEGPTPAGLRLIAGAMGMAAARSDDEPTPIERSRAR